MNKRMRELQDQILRLTETAKGYMADGDGKDLAKAEETLDRIDELTRELDLEKRMVEADKASAPADAAEDPKADSIKAFADAARAGFKAMNEGTGSAGGYTVPDDIQTRINKFRDAKRSLRNLVSVERVTTDSGARTFQTRAQQTGFTLVGEGAAVGQKSTPEFSRLTYTIHKYGGIFAVTNELLADSDANITNVLTEWIGNEARITDNKLILAQIATKDVTLLDDLDDIKLALNVTLGQAFKSSSRIVTNDTGLHFLDTLKDGDGEYLLQRSPADPMQLHLCAGATTIPLEVVPNGDLPNTDVYHLTADTEIVSGRTYYTRSGSGTSESPYVYTAVENPSAASLGSYYNKFAGVPVIIGDLAEGLRLFDRNTTTIKQSDTAVVGSSDTYLNAFEEDLVLYRALERLDVEVRDSAAFVNGRIEILV